MTHDEVFPRLPEILGPNEVDADTAPMWEHAASCPRCAAHLRCLGRVALALDEPLERHVVPPRLERAVLEIPALHARPSARRARRPRALLATGVALAVAVTVLVALPTMRPGAAPEARQVALSSASSGVRGTVSLNASGDGQVVRLVMDGMPVAGPYGLWLVGPEGAVLAASFAPRGDGRCVVVARVPRQRWASAVVTRGGGPPSPGVTLASAPL